VGEIEVKANTIQPPFLCFSHLQFEYPSWIDEDVSRSEEVVLVAKNEEGCN